MQSLRSFIILILLTAILALTALFSPFGLRGILLSSILSIDALILVIYAVSQRYYKPRITLIVGGQQSGTPIPVPSNEGSIWLGITTDLKKDISLEEIRVEYDDGLLDISLKKELATEEVWAKAQTGTVNMTVQEYFDENEELPLKEYGRVTIEHSLNHSHPVSLVLSSLPKVKADFIHVYALGYKSTQDEFSFIVRVFSKLEEYEIGPPWNMFSFGSHRHTQSISFKVDSDLDLDDSQRHSRYRFLLGPGKTMMIRNISQ